MWPIVWPRQSGRVTDQRDYTGTKVLFGPLDAKSFSEKELRRVQGGFDSDRVTTPSLEKQGQGKLSEPAADENLAELLRRKAENGVSWSLPAPDRPDVRAAVEQTGLRVRQFYSSVSLLEYNNNSSSCGSSSGSGSSSTLKTTSSSGGSSIGRTTFSVRVGDPVLAEWERRGSALDDVTVYRVHALFEDERGVPFAIPEWMFFWEDIVDASGEPGQPDACMRGRRQLFQQAGRGPDGSDLVLGDDLAGNLNYVMDILRPCTVRHRDEIGDLPAYERRPDHYWYRYQYTPSLLRFEYVPPPAAQTARPGHDSGPAALPLHEAGSGPGRASHWQRHHNEALQGVHGRSRHGVDAGPAGGGAAAVDSPAAQGAPTMVDIFAGLGTVSHAARHTGFEPLWGVESNAAAASAFCANLPGVPDPEATLERFLERVKRREPGVPRPGSVTWLHLSPPCQALSQSNRLRSYRRIQRELFPRLEESVELVRELLPRFITIEETPAFLGARVPLVDRMSLGKRDRQSGEERESGADAGGRSPEEGLADDNDDGIVLEQENSGGTTLAGAGLPNQEAGGFVTARPWLWVAPHLLEAGYQLDLSICNAAHYGAPQVRKRAIMIAARCGSPLPRPPPPLLHHPYSPPNGLGMDDALLNLHGRGGWKSVSVCSEDLGLPPATTVWEGIGDLPALLPREATGGVQGGDGAPGVENMRRGKQLGRDCVPYSPEAAGARVSRFAEYMRQGEKAFLLHHALKSSEQGGFPLDADKPFPTICTSMGKRSSKLPRNRHPLEARWLSVAERKRAQSMPDGIQLMGSLEEQGKQVGNAVPWLLAKALAGVLYQAATGSEPPNPVPNLKGYPGDQAPGRPSSAVAGAAAGMPGRGVARSGGPLAQSTRGQQEQQQDLWDRAAVGQSRPPRSPAVGPRVKHRRWGQHRAHQQQVGDGPTPSLPAVATHVQQRRWGQHRHLGQQHRKGQGAGAGGQPSASPAAVRQRAQRRRSQQQAEAGSSGGPGRGGAPVGNPGPEAAHLRKTTHGTPSSPTRSQSSVELLAQGAQPGAGKAPLPAIQVVEVVDLVSSSDSGEGSSSGFSDFVVWDLTKYGSDGGGL